MSRKRIIVIGSGISSLTCASHLAKAGHSVTILEKNDSIGGRARKFRTETGFTFDMGPSWYWMPEVFEKFYQQFGYTSSDFYELKRLDPSYQVVWEDGTSDEIPADKKELKAWFEKHEKGAGDKLDAYLKDAAFKYDAGMNDLVYKPSLSIFEFAKKKVIFGVFKMHLFSSFAKFIRKYFSHPKILKLLEFPILFLGATPANTPALYSLMNFADLELGTWYPMKGMNEFILAFEKIAREQGVEIITNAAVQKINTEGRKVKSVETNSGIFEADILVSGADYKHTEDLLNGNANYTEKYWDKRVMAPSSLLYYVGVDKILPKLNHHNLFFDKPFEQHAIEIYDKPQWPSDPLFYLCCPSKTDNTVAPEGKENIFFLIPLAPDLKDDLKKREDYFDRMVARVEEFIGEKFKEQICYKRSFCIDDFKNDYNAYKGNAYGLANTLKQTAILKPRITNKNLDNLFYTGQLTVPGPGVPPSIISGEVVAKQVLQTIK